MVVESKRKVGTAKVPDNSKQLGSANVSKAVKAKKALDAQLSEEQAKLDRDAPAYEQAAKAVSWVDKANFFSTSPSEKKRNDLAAVVAQERLKVSQLQTELNRAQMNLVNVLKVENPDAELKALAARQNALEGLLQSLEPVRTLIRKYTASVESAKQSAATGATVGVLTHQSGENADNSLRNVLVGLNAVSALASGANALQISKSAKSAADGYNKLAGKVDADLKIADTGDMGALTGAVEPLHDNLQAQLTQNRIEMVTRAEVLASRYAE